MIYKTRLDSTGSKIETSLLDTDHKLIVFFSFRY